MGLNKEIELRLDTNYLQFLENTRDRLRKAQVCATLAVNRELLHFYWQLGLELIEKQRVFQWGDRFLEQFSEDIRQAFPGMQGFSITNLKRMRLFAKEYPEFEKSAQAVHQLPWGHIVLLLHRIKQPEERTWYAEQIVANGWSRSMLESQIEKNLFKRQGIALNKISNFHAQLPPEQSHLATELLKDPYQFDFLTIQGKAHERALESALIEHMRDFLLELGQGFAFVGSQVPLTFEDQEFFIDLLFWHLKLIAFIVIELKSTKLKPEHTGQLGFYLAAVDDQLRQPGDNKTIGILLCKSKNKFVAEYALRNISAPIGISEYTLSKALPKELKTSQPAIEEIEAELNEAVKRSDADQTSE